jgi:hypothetical protein
MNVQKIHPVPISRTYGFEYTLEEFNAWKIEKEET